MMSLTGKASQESDFKLRQLLSASIDASGKDRSQIARELSSLIGREFTVSQINDYTATTKIAARFPASYVAAFCEVTGSDQLIRFLLPPKLRSLIELAECELAAQRQLRAKGGMVKELLTDGKDRSL